MNNIKSHIEKLRGSSNNLRKDVKDLQDVVFSANYGLPRKFIDKNSDLVIKSNKAVSETLASFGVNNFSRSGNSLQELTSLVSSSIRYRSRSNKVTRSINSKSYVIGDDTVDLETGIKDISPVGNIDQGETEAINQSALLYQSFLNTTTEYRGVCELIPQVGRAIENIVRDILCVSDLSGRILNKIYDSDGANESISDTDKKDIAAVTKLLQDEIIDKNNLEEKLKRWVYESLVCGVKPIALIPYSYIIKQLRQLNAADSALGLHVNSFTDAVRSGESYKICENKDQEEEFHKISIESSTIDMCVGNDRTKDPSMTAESIIEGILDDDLIEQFARSYESDFATELDEITYKYDRIADDQIKHEHIYGTKSTEAINQLELLESAKTNFTKKKNELKKQTPEQRKANARKGLKQLARFIDEHIDVVKPGASSAFLANKIMNHKDRYQSFYNLGENYYMAEGLQKRVHDEPDKDDDLGNYGEDKLHYDDDSELGKNCLIIPFSPESIIPININGEYMGFYCLEYENTAGPFYKKQKRTGSFTDYIKAQGYGDDSSLLGGSGGPMLSFGASDPLDNNLYSPLALYNYSVNQYLYGGQDQLDAKFDIMKTVVLRVLAHRLRDPELADNKLFKDAVMTMLRNDVLTRKKVQFTFIPPEYMVYMTYKTDDDGIPKSILDGTLLFAYMYIASTMSSVMIKLLKSGDKEKYTVNVGLQKNAGYTVDELQRVLSTRDVYTDSMFGNLASVIKNAGAYQRLIIPVVNDRKLYDVEQIETVNNVSPDDEITDKLLNAILSKIGINAGMQSSLDGADFAHEFAYRNREYNDSITASQDVYEKFITRIIKNITHYSTLKTYNSKTENIRAIKSSDDNDNLHYGTAIDLSRIHVELTAPTMLNMTNISEVLDAAKNVANSITEVFNLQDGSPMETARNTLFKRKIVEKFANIVEWAEIEKLLSDAEYAAPSEVAKNQKFAKIDAKMAEDDPNNPEGGGMDMGGGMGGGMDQFGGGTDMGGELGADEFGGDTGAGQAGSPDAF